MAATVWKGYITFGLISVPVRLHTAARSERVSFNQLHKTCHTRIKQQLYCPTCDSATRQRQQMKALLGELEAQHPRLYSVLRTTLAPLLRADATGGLPMPSAVQVLADLRRREPVEALPVD